MSGQNAATPVSAAREAARIDTELHRLDGGTDPFASAVRATRMPMIVTDPRLPDNPIVFVNDAFLRLTGYSREEILGRNCRFLQGAQTDQVTVGRIRAAIAAREPIETEIRNHRKDGSTFWNRVLIAPVRNEAGEVTYFFASQFDVTLERERLASLEADNDLLSAQLATRAEALRESENRFYRMADSAPVMIWTADGAGLRTWISRSWTTFTGQTEAGALGNGWLEAVHPEDRAAATRDLREALAEGRFYRSEYRLRRADGLYAWVLETAVPRLDSGSDGLGYVGSVLDISDRRAAQARLELSEESLRLATEAAGVGTWDLDLTTDVLTWSDRTKAMFGISPHVACSMTDFYGGLHEMDREATTAAFAAALDPARRTGYDVEYRTVGREDRLIRWIAAKGRGMFDASGRCIRAVGTAIDVTAARAAQNRQATLLALADRLRTPGDSRAIAAAATDTLGAHFGASRVGYALIRFDGPALSVTEDLSDSDTNPHLPPVQPFPIDALGSRGVDELRLGRVAVRDDVASDSTANAARWHEAGIRAVVVVPLIRDGVLSASFYVGLRQPRTWSDEDVRLVEDVAARVWDAAERARVEDALRQLNATLEARVEAGTAELRRAEEALRQSQKMEAVGQLTGGIAHDFNNLLTGIAGALELLQRRVKEGRYGDLHRYASVAVTSANRAAALTQRLLAFARRQPLDPKPVDVNRLTSGMEDLLRRTIGPSVELEIVAGAAVWTTICDPNQLESALLNLAINARDAMPQGGRLTIESANASLDDAYVRREGGELKAGQYVLLSVTDTGTGMSEDVMARAFEPFFTTKPLGEGTGLGLSQLYGFIKQSDGHVRIYSEVGRGTTFRLYLPRHRGQGDSVPETALTERPAAPPGPRGTVLVVEDEPPIRMLIAEVLEDLGFSVIEAVNANVGLQALRSDMPIQLLITDVGLPGLNGRELADAARALRPGLKILFITGFAGNAAIGNGMLEAGMQILTKPFALEALAAKVSRLAAAD